MYVCVSSVFFSLSLPLFDFADILFKIHGEIVNVCLFVWWWKFYSPFQAQFCLEERKKTRMECKKKNNSGVNIKRSIIAFSKVSQPNFLVIFFLLLLMFVHWCEPIFLLKIWIWKQSRSVHEFQWDVWVACDYGENHWYYRNNWIESRSFWHLFCKSFCMKKREHSVAHLLF